VELGQLLELLSVDRRSAGEARPAPHLTPLKTVAYTMPWRVQARRRWRSDRRLRLTSWSSCLAAAAALVLWQVAPWSTPSSLSSEPGVSAAARPRRAEQAASATQARQPAQDAPSPATDQTSDELPALSARRRLQRADLWLRVGTARADHEARALLQSALHELPSSAHGQAALAEACLRLHDQTCARDAIDEAMRLRPWRGGYRVLSRRVDAAVPPRE